jgi:hypothetical protein
MAPVFIDCSVEESARANRCTVYKDNSGEVQVSGLFELSGAGREAKQNELQFLAFDGARIWLKDARSLNPVRLLEYAVPGLQNQLADLAGKDALNCGLVTRNQKPSAASHCALKAFADGKPFYVSYDQELWGGGYTVGYALDTKGNLYFVEYLSERWPLQPATEGVHIADNNHIRFGDCPKPAHLFEFRDGELTCVASTE